MTGHRNQCALAGALLGALATIAIATAAAAEERPHGPGADEIFWTPTLAQGLDMARETGRSLFLIGYSLIPGAAADPGGETFAYQQIF